MISKQVWCQACEKLFPNWKLASIHALSIHPLTDCMEEV